MDLGFGAVSIARSIKCMFAASVWPNMATQHMLRGYVNDVETYCIWVVGDAYVLADNDSTNDDTEATWKGRLVWTVNTWALRVAGQSGALTDKTFWRIGRLHVLTSAPWTRGGGQICIQFDPPAQPDEIGDVTMLVLDFVGMSMWQYKCLKRAQPTPRLTGPLVALLHWASPPSAAASSNVFQNTFPGPCADVLRALPESLHNLDDEQFQAIQGISASVAPANFIHSPIGTGSTHVLKCLIHGWNRIRRAGTFVVLVLRTTELREEMWNNLSGILPKEQLTSASQAPPQSAGSRAPRGHDPKAQWANLVSSQLSQALTAQDNDY